MGEQVNLVMNFIYKDGTILKDVLGKLEKKYGRIDFIGEEIEFSFTDYYEKEMGKHLFRKFVSFEKLISPNEIVEIKHAITKIEKEYALTGKRQINIDPGYMDFNKIVLASYKYGWQKIYLNDNVWADMVLHYKKGNWFPFEWSFLDYKSGLYNKDLTKIREKFKIKIKK